MEFINFDWRGLSYSCFLKVYLVIGPWHEALAFYGYKRVRPLLKFFYYLLVARLNGLDVLFSAQRPVMFCFVLFMAHVPFPAYCRRPGSLSTSFLYISLPAFSHMYTSQCRHRKVLL